MTEERQLELLDEACAEHDRLTHALAAARTTQECLLSELLDAALPTRLRAAARDLQFAVGGNRAHGIALDASLFLVIDDEEESWALLERRAHGLQAVVSRVGVGMLLDTFRRDAARIVLDALACAELQIVVPPPASHASVTRLPASGSSSRTPTRACPHCDAHPNVENYARHLRTIHGPATAPRTASAQHQVCRLCGARLPAGRLDPHLTAMHGIFHVHPHGDREENRREAARRSTQRTRVVTSAPPGLANARPARDFLAEARHERTLVARADSPHRNRDREGRFSDAPDVERMDGESRS